MIKWLRGKKQYILGGLMFLHGFVSFLVGDMPFMEMIQGSQELLEMFGGAFMGANRAAMKKAEIPE